MEREWTELKDEIVRALDRSPSREQIIAWFGKADQLLRAAPELITAEQRAVLAWLEAHDPAF